MTVDGLRAGFGNAVATAGGTGDSPAFRSGVFFSAFSGVFFSAFSGAFFSAGACSATRGLVAGAAVFTTAFFTIAFFTIAFFTTAFFATAFFTTAFFAATTLAFASAAWADVFFPAATVVVFLVDVALAMRFPRERAWDCTARLLVLGRLRLERSRAPSRQPRSRPIGRERSSERSPVRFRNAAHGPLPVGPGRGCHRRPRHRGAHRRSRHPHR